MAKKRESYDVFAVPRNFGEDGMSFNGLSRRNLVEGIILALASGYPIVTVLSASTSLKVILICFVSLPLFFVGLVGFGGESLSQFIFTVIKWLFTRRRLRYYIDIGEPEPPKLKGFAGFKATQNRVAGASRRDAMILRQRTILNARGTGSEFRVNEGTRCMARVLHVSRNLVRVEVFGFETYVRIDNISNLWVNDVREVVRVGEEKPVEITSLTRDENGRVTSMRVSMKAAEDAPQLELREGNTYTGNISNFSATAYYVRVAGIPVEVRCPINSNYTMELMEQGDFVKFFVRAIYDGVPTGAILKIIKKKNAGM